MNYAFAGILFSGPTENGKFSHLQRKTADWCSLRELFKSSLRWAQSGNQGQNQDSSRDLFEIGANSEESSGSSWFFWFWRIFKVVFWRKLFRVLGALAALKSQAGMPFLVIFGPSKSCHSLWLKAFRAREAIDCDTFPFLPKRSVTVDDFLSSHAWGQRLWQFFWGLSKSCHSLRPKISLASSQRRYMFLAILKS